MKRVVLFLIFIQVALVQYGQIIADHTVVDKYDEIPQQYIDAVKKMLVDIAGESHSLGYRTGQNLLEVVDSKYQVLTYDGSIPAYSTQYLRLGRHGTVGEATFYTSQTSINSYKSLITSQNNTGNPYSVLGFGWCWDMTWTNAPGGVLDPVHSVHWAGSSEGGPNGNLRWGLDSGDQTLTSNSVSMDTYLNAVEQYIQHCTDNGYATKVIFTTGPVDDGDGTMAGTENGYQREIKHDYIRNYVAAGSSRILFDYADILCWNNSGVEYITNWNDGGTIRPHANIHPDNMKDYDGSWNMISHTEDGDHIGEVGALRLAKAMWWLLSRIAGWDGRTSIPTGTWLGVTTDWHDTSNWPVEIPTVTTDVIISSSTSNQPFVFSSPTAICNTLILNTNASLTIAAGQAVTVHGNLTNNGNIIIESARVNSNGSLIVGSASGTGTVTYNRYLREGDDYGDKHLFSSPVLGQSISDFISAYGSKIDSVRIWDEVNAVWSRVTSGNFVSGKGYNVYQADASDGGFSFTGAGVNSAFINATSPYRDPYSLRGTDPYGVVNHVADIWASPRSWTNYGGGGWNLLGNPFTSALKITDTDTDLKNDFLNANNDSFDPSYLAVYIYDGVRSQYLYNGKSTGFIYPTESPVDAPFGYNDVQAGQGFFVLANNNDATFSFTSAMQIHSIAVPMTKSAMTENSWSGLQLKVKYGSKESLTTVFYHEIMTAGLDPGYDIGQFSSGPKVEIYTSLVEKDNSVNFACQALPISGADTIIVPIGIDSEKGGGVTFSAYTVQLENYYFWLEDRMKGIFTDLSTSTYSVTLPANTYGAGRFFLYASTNMPTAVRPKPVDLCVKVWISDNKVIIKGSVSEKAICEVYDLGGKKVSMTHLAGGELNIVNMNSAPGGVYLVRIVDGLKVTAKRVMLF